MKLIELTALELSKKLRAGEISAKEAAQVALDQIAATQAHTNAFITLSDQVLDQAELAQKLLEQKNAPALAGVPMALKDNLCTQGIKTTCASKIMGGYIPPYSATAAERLYRAGGICLGKLNMDEFAMGSTNETSYYGPVKNPWDESCSPGGSSGGAAAAVASGACWYALGTDTGGSIRQPAAFCGVTGIKPTYGAVSRYGLIAYASSLDQIGPIARSAADCAAVLDTIMGRDPHDSSSLDRTADSLLDSLSGDLRGTRVGLPMECFQEGLDPEVAQAVLQVAEVLQTRGAEVERFQMPVLRYAVPAYYILACAEASSNLSRFDGVKYGWRVEEYADLEALMSKTRSAGFGSEVKRRILLGAFVLSSGYYEAYYKKAQQARAVLCRAFEDAFRRFDFLLSPVAPACAPRLGESLSDPLKMYLSDVYTVPANLAGLPALSMPCGFHSSGLPVGAQLIGPSLGEGKILNAAYAYQLETDFHQNLPKGGKAL